jgi:cobaltochelatase CobS
MNDKQKQEVEKLKIALKVFEGDTDEKALRTIEKIKSEIEAIEKGSEVKEEIPEAKQGDNDLLKQVLKAVEEAIEIAKKGGAGVDEKAVLEILGRWKVSKSNLGQDVIAYIESKRSVEFKAIPNFKYEVKGEMPNVFYKIVSDLSANNNVYLYGSAGTGKTFIAQEVADAMNCTLITINCNQYTSPLEIQGGQTIDGYQEGKLIVSWANLTKNEEEGVSGGMEEGKHGVILLLDELPKIDPNTAGILNDALAKVKKIGRKSIIQNAKGDFFEKKNFYCIATGNARLNEESTDYVANFRQDLSLQDRFIGCTYEVSVPMNVELSDAVLGKFLFIFNYMNKVRNLINSTEGKNMSMDSKAFVSMRIMESLRDSWRFWYENHKAEPKTKSLRNGIDAFFSLFTNEQRSFLIEKSGYSDFVDKKIPAMAKVPLGENRKEDEDEAKASFKEWESKQPKD